ncbi:Bifunctional purine biosynthetic protein ADE5,7 [Tilletia horrida]|uniref:phosphoribosylglycinamide formyltransferase 1 n=1 Tax=Tilletia horrida TaxID=155126 RepID=A0AAN6JHK6_9BASI|nr:Bifunctional purine biosynthetic protein ADE5,7 [Tilletia horrida]
MPSQPTAPIGRRSTEGRRVLVLISGSGTNLQALIDATVPTPDPTNPLPAGGVDTQRELLPNAQIVGVISNRKAAFGLQRAQHSADPPIPSEVFSLKMVRDQRAAAAAAAAAAAVAQDQAEAERKLRAAYDEGLAERVKSYAPDLVVLAGFMHIVSPTFLAALGHSTTTTGATETDSSSACAVPIINLHPALPGAFDGIHAIERAYAAFERGEIDKTGVMVHRVIAEVDRGEPVLVEEIELGDKREVVDSVEALATLIHAVEHRLIVRGARAVLEGRA